MKKVSVYKNLKEKSDNLNKTGKIMRTQFMTSYQMQFFISTSFRLVMGGC